MTITIVVQKNAQQITNCPENFRAHSTEWDLGDPIGQGATEAEAITDLQGWYELKYDGQLAEGEKIELIKQLES